MKKRKIVIVERGGSYIAYFSNDPGTGKWVLGNSIEEAIGKLILKFAEGLDIEIETEKSIWNIREKVEEEKNG